MDTTEMTPTEIAGLCFSAQDRHMKRRRARAGRTLSQIVDAKRRALRAAMAPISETERNALRRALRNDA